MPFDKNIPFRLPQLPPPFNPRDPLLFDALLKARTALAELKGYTPSLPNPYLLLSPTVLKEAIASSEIENIHTTMIGVLQNQLFPEKDQRTPDKEVLRYNEAMYKGIKSLDNFSIYSSRQVLAIKDTLMQHPNKGYREHQNSIINERTKEIRYTPPLAGEIPTLLSNIEHFLHNKNDGFDPLLKCAISHYQFEAIHPFEDGNGRTGRILMVLHLVAEGLLDYPILFISGYINAYRKDYYDYLKAVSSDNKWMDYILFMLRGFYEQAVSTKKYLFEIMNLYVEMKKEIKAKHHKIYTADLLEALFSYPVITPVKLSKELGIHYVTASKYLTELAKSGFLKSEHYGKYHLFLNEKLIKILDR